MSTVLPPTTPQQMNETFAKAYTSGDIDNINRLFEPTAKVVSYDGTVITGKDNYHQEHVNLLRLGGSMTSVNKFCVEMDDIALLSADWTINTEINGEPKVFQGTSSEVVRKQSDGTWLYIIDNPFSK